MSGNEEGLYEKKLIESEGGVILGYWDHEKTPTLIQDLERSIYLVERKCKKLLQELIHYKKYLDEHENPDAYVTFLKKKTRKSKNCNSLTGSDPDVTFRKNLIYFQQVQKMFEEKFQAKLLSINKELKDAANKIGLKNKIILFPTNEYMKALNEQTEHDAEKSWNNVREKFIQSHFLKKKAKSDCLLINNGNKEEFSKITKNELKLYQKLSRLNFEKKENKNWKVKRRKVKFGRKRKLKICSKRKSPRFYSEPKMGAAAATKKSRFAVKRLRKKKQTLTVTEEEENDSFPNLCSRKRPGEKASEPEVKILGEPLVEIGNRKNLEPLEERTSLGTVVRKTVPFVACTSTSKSHNIGLNIQQLLSLSKLSKKLNGRNLVSGTACEGKRDQSTRKLKDINFADVEKDVTKWSPVSDVNAQDLKGKIWSSKEVSEDSPLNIRKMRSKYTGSSSEGFLRYHKSVTSQYTNGHNSVIKSESKTAYAVGSKIMVSDCHRTDVFALDKCDHFFENASGDGLSNASCAQINAEWTKVHASFLNVYRKYLCLKENVAENESAPYDEELNALEIEIDDAIEKYKDFLQFYNKFLHLKNRLKSLKFACETNILGPVMSFFSSCPRKRYAYKSSHSMAAKIAFKEVQALQDKIRLIND